MPVAGQDAFLDTAAFEREAHMGAAIVQGKDVPALMYQQYRAMAAVHDKPPFGFQFFEGAGTHEIRDRSIHRRLIRQASRGQRHSARAFLECQSSLRCTPPADQPGSAVAVQPDIVRSLQGELTIGDDKEQAGSDSRHR
jgi:hypothetical protein